MYRYILFTCTVFFLVAGYFAVRKFVDRTVEKKTDTEVVREGEEYLGNWASKIDSGLTMFRLHRNGELTYRFVKYPGTDTTTILGKYNFVGAGGGNDARYFPRLYTFNQSGDTIFNYYVRYLTKYDMTVEKIDKMVLSPTSVYDTLGYTFYRIKN